MISIKQITQNILEDESPNLIGQTKFRLNQINKIKYYFNSEIPEKKIMSKNKINI